MPWTILLTQWRSILLASVIAYSVIMTMHARALTAQRDEARANLEHYIQQAKVLSDAAQKQSEKAVKEIRNEIPQLVAQAEKSAYQNYLKRYGLGSCNRLPNLPASSPGGKAESSQGANAASGEQLVIESCARDAGRLNLWIKWAELNELEVK